MPAELWGLEWSLRIAGLGAALHAVELLRSRADWADRGVWSWPVLRREYRPAERRVLDPLLGERGFGWLLRARLALALGVTVAPHASLVVFVLLSGLLISMRYRGSHNGGSDAMTTVLWLGLSVAAVASATPLGPWLVRAAAWYIALQVCASYFVAGWVKVREATWRRGETLVPFLQGSCYGAPEGWVRWLSAGRRARCLSWALMLFELAFPLSLLDPMVCLAFMTAGVGFHLANVFTLGLNRFVWAWVATYPVLWACSMGL